MAFPQFAELWKLMDLLVRKDFRQANLGDLSRGIRLGARTEFPLGTAYGYAYYEQEKHRQ